MIKYKNTNKFTGRLVHVAYKYVMKNNLFMCGAFRYPINPIMNYHRGHLISCQGSAYVKR